MVAIIINLPIKETTLYLKLYLSLERESIVMITENMYDKEKKVKKTRVWVLKGSESNVETEHQDHQLKSHFKNSIFQNLESSQSLCSDIQI